MSYVHLAPNKTSTCCIARMPVDERHPEHPVLGPMVCGRLAVGPHPDPAIGYREAYCAEHMPTPDSDEKERT